MSRVFRYVEVDGREVAAVEDHLGMSLYHGQREIISFGLSAEAAGALGWFLLKYWMRSGAAWAWLQLRPWRWTRHHEP